MEARTSTISAILKEYRMFQGEESLPHPYEHQLYFSQISQYLDQTKNLTPNQVLRAFLGFELDCATLHLTGLDHVAVYLGDYLLEPQFENWLHFLEHEPRVDGLRFGPSYIAPRHYGTPGHWINCRVAGWNTEMFSCKRFGAWEGFAHCRKIRLMSHLALAVADGVHVKPVLDFLSHHPDVELLAFNAGDELDHTYGHLLNHRTHGVLELVHHPR